MKLSLDCRCGCSTTEQHEATERIHEWLAAKLELALEPVVIGTRTYGPGLGQKRAGVQG